MSHYVVTIMKFVVFKSQDLRFILVGDHKYVVGRQSCDINIQDASVSRRQAILTMAHYESNVVRMFKLKHKCM